MRKLERTYCIEPEEHKPEPFRLQRPTPTGAMTMPYGPWSASFSEDKR
jgi:hypothetical protein